MAIYYASRIVVLTSDGLLYTVSLVILFHYRIYIFTSLAMAARKKLPFCSDDIMTAHAMQASTNSRMTQTVTIYEFELQHSQSMEI